MQVKAAICNLLSRHMFNGPIFERQILTKLTKKIDFYYLDKIGYLKQCKCFLSGKPFRLCNKITEIKLTHTGAMTMNYTRWNKSEKFSYQESVYYLNPYRKFGNYPISLGFSMDEPQMLDNECKGHVSKSQPKWNKYRICSKHIIFIFLSFLINMVVSLMTIYLLQYFGFGWIKIFYNTHKG